MAVAVLEKPRGRRRSSILDRSDDLEHLSRRVGRAIDPDELERIARLSGPHAEPVPVAFTDLFAASGRLVRREELAPPDDPVFGMAGFATYDAIINALSVNGKGQFPQYQKTSFTTASGQVHDYWLASGVPAAGVFGTALTGTIPTSATTGALPFTNATGPAQMFLLSLWGMSSAALGTLVLYDRVAEYPLNGTVTSGTWGTQPALTRDAAGGATGTGVVMFVENVGATANTSVTLTITYTNDAGTGSRSTGAQTLLIGAVSANRVLNPNNTLWFPLQTGDKAVKSIQSYVLSATATSTTINVVLARPLIILPVFATNAAVERDTVMQIASLPRIYDNSALSFMLFANTTTSPLQGGLTLAEN